MLTMPPKKRSIGPISFGSNRKMTQRNPKHDADHSDDDAHASSREMRKRAVPQSTPAAIASQRRAHDLRGVDVRVIGCS